MTGDKFSLFGNANNASYPTPVGIQGGDNVQLPPNALARAIQDSIAVNVPFPFTGSISAFNLSGTNTGDQPPLGLTGVLRPASITVGQFTKNRITANSVALTTPAAPSDFCVIQVLIESALTGCSVVAGSGQTVNGLSSWNLDITPCFVEFSYNLSTTNWFVTSARFGTT